MMNTLRRGRLEVETDLLLGVDDVLLPLLSRRPQLEQAPSQSVDTPSVGDPQDVVGRRSSGRSFDPALFAPTGRSSPVIEPKPKTSTVGEITPVSHRARLAAPSGSSLKPVDVGVVSEEGLLGQTAIPSILDAIVPPSGATRADQLAALERMHAEHCPHCTSATGATRLVFGDGHPDAELVFVGEAPGDAEDELGRPFVGKSGEKLDEMIGAMGLRRENVYITHIVKCRPPNNRTPLPQEIERCGPYLLAQLAIIRPKIVVTLGGPASKVLLQRELGITRLRGNLAQLTLGRAQGTPFVVSVMPTLHPAYLIRNYTMETRRQVWEDLKVVLEVLGRPVPTKSASAS